MFEFTITYSPISSRTCSRVGSCAFLSNVFSNLLICEQAHKLYNQTQTCYGLFSSHNQVFHQQDSSSNSSSNSNSSLNYILYIEMFKSKARARAWILRYRTFYEWNSIELWIFYTTWARAKKFLNESSSTISIIKRFMIRYTYVYKNSYWSNLFQNNILI